MPFIELPRALEDYFAFAETEPTRRGRRFSITLPFHNGEKLERMQWWYHVSAAEEQMFEGHGMLVLRQRGIERFRRHIERWLEINRFCLHGDEPVPRLSRRQPAHPPQTNESSAAPRHEHNRPSHSNETPATTMHAPAWSQTKTVNG